MLCCGNALKNNVQKIKSQTFKKEVFSSLSICAFLSVFLDFFGVVRESELKQLNAMQVQIL